MVSIKTFFTKKEYPIYNREIHKYLDVPFEAKDEVKSTRKAFFDMDKKKWFTCRTETELIKKYPLKVKYYFDVEYDDIDKAKTLGARWCKLKKSWYSFQPNIINLLK
jgi:hypothetical protein